MLLNPRRAPYVCTKCLARQTRVSRRYQSTATSPPSPPSSGAAKLTTRRLISLHGAETPKFLQGMVTNNVRTDSASGFYATFLTAQGKVLHDTFVYPTIGSDWHKQQGGSGNEAGYLVEVDGEQADVLLKHLKRHKLRSKFKLRLLDQGELDIWSRWKEGEPWTAHGASSGQPDDGMIHLTDSRAPGMGQRVLVPEGRKNDVLQDVEETKLESYTIRRYLRGVPEGQKEMPRDEVLPMNCNIDIMGGIDFKKGCYLGQELTIRTHHTGVVRRRVLPITIYDTAGNDAEKLEFSPAAEVDAGSLVGSDIKKDDKRKRSTGKIIAGIGSIGLGMCRLEQMTDLKVTAEDSSFKPEDKFLAQTADGQEFGIKAHVPDWVRGSIREPKQQKRVE
ncbi:Putative GTP-binding protein TrmE/Aminomethyltransferase GcvT, domain 1 [Septoria linicola]|uniref:Iron-sulfur cluster assembly factor IBA57 homolog, mitochondrial n=1 Tax=Septoria linicola TaxID=215465 RepID=A0A9Q9EFZ5_9PEZI|nr:Putative GTP-binding protein TrmE/Aminomethyltransferase GcvT, domain 1 [Septoria linicola]